MDKQIIASILNGEATEKEKNDFFLHCEANPEVKDEYIKLKNLWALADNEEMLNKKQSFENFWVKTKGSNSKRLSRILLETVKYAAILIIAVGITFFINPGKNGNNDFVQTFKSEKGSVSSIELSDGSKIWLNSGSTLNFTEKNEKRIVAKLSGEAYFEIVHDDNREFLIDAGNIKIRDIGTKFNVKAYDEDERLTATLIEGKIDIQNSNGKSLLELAPNDHFSYAKSTREYSLEKIDPSVVGGWKDGKFVFINRNLREICDELEKWYDVEIVINNQSVESAKFTSVLRRTTTIKQMMEMLKITASINYEIKTNKNGLDIIAIH